MIVIGDYIKDKYIFGTSTRLSPEAPVPVINELREEVRPGGAANVVENLKALGENPLFIYNPNQKTVKTRIIANGHILCRLDDEEYRPMHLVFDEDISAHKYAVLSDYGKGVLHQPQTIIKRLNMSGVKVLVDPKKRFREYTDAWLIKSNKVEFELEIDKPYNWDTFLCDAQFLCKKYGFSYIIVTLGSEGFAYYDAAKNISRLVPCPKKTVIDVTGAGDVFMAALAHFVRSHRVFDAATKANILASISVSHMGTYVLTKEDIAQVIQKTVFTNGCFDILHPGHIHLLKESKKLGNKLIVGLNSDDSVRRLKGPNRPILSQDQRKKMLEALEIADEVIIFDEDTPLELIKRVKPNIITKGDDYMYKDIVGHELAYVVRIPRIDNYSTTGVINEIVRKS